MATNQIRLPAAGGALPPAYGSDRVIVSTSTPFQELLIALEFNHTLQYVVTRHQSIIQTKVVLLIALLALARKFIILDLSGMTPGYLFGRQRQDYWPNNRCRMEMCVTVSLYL